MAKVVLVTGASGFIGREVVPALEGAGWRVVRAVRDTARCDGAGANVKLDLDCPREVLALGEKLRCDAIVHLGARVGLAGETDADLYLPNVLATGCLASLAHRWGARLILASSVMVHGAGSSRIQSDSPLQPDTAYGRSKLLGEQVVAASGADCCILRIAGVFGFRGPMHLGLNRAIAAGLKGERPLQMGPGNALRNYVYVRDVAKAIAYALENKLSGTHLVAGSEVLTIARLLQSLCDTLLPGEIPRHEPGCEAGDQVVAPSPSLPGTRSFLEALIDIRNGAAS